MRYLTKQLHNYGIPFDSDSWGPCIAYIEIDDQHVSRQVNVDEDGRMLRYDRTHWCDDFGMMFIGRFTRKRKAAIGFTITDADEFERQWQRALRSSLWSQQVERTRDALWGTWEDRVDDGC